jgi:hypothetical protein
MIHLWTPYSYGTPPTRVRRNPNASVYEQVIPGDDVSPDVRLTPNGQYLAGPAEDAVKALEAAGPRGAAAVGVLAGFLLSGWKMALTGGVLGYFGGKFVSNFVGKALAVSAASRVETSVTKATS